MTVQRRREASTAKGSWRVVREFQSHPEAPERLQRALTALITVEPDPPRRGGDTEESESTGH